MVGVSDRITGKQIKPYVYAGALAVFFLALLAYLPSIQNGFVNWDDIEYVYENTRLFSLHFKSLRWMITSLEAHNWHPFTWLSHAVDCALWGLNPRGHHSSNVLLHAFNTLLVYLLIIRMLLAKTGRNTQLAAKGTGQTHIFIVALMTALLFGLHPLHVESVAWISERKDLLCAFFSLLCLSAYLSYVAADAGRQKATWFITSILLFLFALMSKPMAVTIPATLCLLDIYPLGRLTRFSGRPLRILLEKAPFIVMSLGSAVITLIAQSDGAVRGLDQFPMQVRVMNAFRALIFYLKQMLWPESLVPFYPFPSGLRWFSTEHALSAAAVATIFCICFWMVKRGRLLPGTVWAYYVITLLPVIGIVQVGKQAAADRYTYLPSMGIFLLAGLGVAWVYGKIIARKRSRVLAGLLLAGIAAGLIGLGQKTLKQIQVWHSSETLWKHVISVFPHTVPIAHNNLGLDYSRQGRLDEALSHYQKAVMIDPGYVEAHSNLGILYHSQGKFNEALSCYAQALSIDPHYVEAENNRGLTYFAMGRHDQSLSSLNGALAINPDFAEAHYNLGHMHAAQGMLDDAIASYRQAVAIDPYYVEAHYNLGNAYFDKHLYDQSIAAYKKALEVNPAHAMAYNNLGNAYANKKLPDDAIAAYKKALAVNPDYITAYNNLGTTYLETGLYDRALETFQNALARAPHDPTTNKNLALGHYLNKEYKLAVFYCDKSLELGYSIPSEFIELLKPYR